MKNIFCKAKKIILGIALLILIAPNFVFAVEFGLQTQTKEYGIQKVFASSSLAKIGIARLEPLFLAQEIVRVVLGLVGILLFGFVFYAGFIWIKAQGNSGEVDKAKDIIENALYGIIIITLAYGISEFIFGQLIK